MIQKLLTVKFSKITVSKGCLHAQTVYNVHMLNTTTHSLIAAAIAPMRDAAIARAESMMTKRIDWVLAKLEADGGDANINFAYPHSRMSRSDYRAKESAYNFVGRITTGAARICSE